MEREFRPTIFAKWSKAGVVSITDNLSIRKVLFSATERGKDNVKSYLEMSKALTLANAILTGNFSKLWPAMTQGNGYTVTGKYAVFGGTAHSKSYNGKPESRIIEIEQLADKDPKTDLPRIRFTITIRVGEGVVQDNGTISPKDYRNMIFQRQFLTAEEAFEMASLLKMHIESYYARYMEQFYDAKGNVPSDGSIDDCFKVKFRAGGDSAPSYSSSGSDFEIPQM